MVIVGAKCNLVDVSKINHQLPFETMILLIHHSFVVVEDAKKEFECQVLNSFPF